MTAYRNDIRNIAIIAHVDHGKTTMVDALLKQSKVFRDNQDVGDLIMDSGDLEREKGITIMAKNTAINYKDVKINIIDTPGHADFSGEVERVISMADGCLLIVDSVEGPMPQTRFVLQKALEGGLKPIVVINKIDRKDARVDEVIQLTQDLFLELATRDDQLDFPILYASGRQGWVTKNLGEEGTNVMPLLDTILEVIPPPAIEEGPFQMLVSTLDYDSHKGKISVGRIWRGSIKPHDKVACMYEDGKTQTFEVAQLFTFYGMKKLETESASAGDIIALTGVSTVDIGDTLADPEHLDALPRIHVDEPTVEMTLGVNTSPFAGREGKFTTTRQIRERLMKELETNLSLRVLDTGNTDKFIIKGRGELHLSVLIETMRREGYEFEISKPEAITKIVDGVEMEPVEELTIDTKETHVGVITEMLASRQAEMRNMINDGNGNVRLVYKIPTKGLIGFRNPFMTATRGEGVMNTVFLDFEPKKGNLTSTRSAVLVASEGGTVLSYGLTIAQERGITFISPNTEVYEGMIIGQTNRSQDIAINVCKEKKKTNVRSSTADIAIKLVPPVVMSLEQSIDFINKDELVEITPKSIRLRKKILNETMRNRERHREETATED
jgi:GTP-binding protein